jgi:spermidine synthase
MTEQSPIRFQILKDVNRADMANLYQDAGWWDPSPQSDAAVIDAIVKNSYCFIGAFLNDRMIGMGRSLSDGVSDAYIQDVVVLREFRGQGIGRQIILNLVNYLVDQHIGWIGLIGEPNTEAFYQRLGFRPLQHYTPMIWKPNHDESGNQIR